MDWMMNKFYGDWDSLEDMAKEFREDISIFNGANILFAAYEYADYSGSAYVLYEYEGNLYEVNGGHCSCYGLEDQWNPEETSKEEVLYRLNKGSSYGIFHGHKKEIKEALEGYDTGPYVAKFFEPEVAEKITETGQEILKKMVGFDSPKTELQFLNDEINRLRKELREAKELISVYEESATKVKVNLENIIKLCEEQK
jgi:hypothetical protein